MDRKTLRGQVTKIFNDITEKLETPESAQETTELELRILLKRLTTANANLQAANAAQTVPMEPSAAAKEQETVSDYEDKVAVASAKLEFFIEKSQKGTTTSNSNAQTPAANVTRLPQIELRSFGGDAKDWLPFWEQFKRTVHENKALDGTTKFCLLQAHLKGRAAETLTGFSPTQAAYNDAVEVLKEEYGSTDRILEAHLKTLTSLPKIASPRDAVGLRKLYTTVVTTMRSLQALGIETTQYSLILRSQLVASLPPNLQMQFHRQLRNIESGDGAASTSGSTTEVEGTNLQELLNYIRCEVETLELCSPTPAPATTTASTHRSSKNPFRGKRSANNSAGSYTAAGLFTSNAKNATKDNCFFCEKPHPTEACRSSLSIEAKKNKLREAHRCFRCTRKDHSAKGCHTAISCTKCSDRHATTMCDPEWRKRTQEQRSSNATNQSAGITSTPGQSTNDNKQQVATFTVDKRESHVFLQTACVSAINPEELSANLGQSIRIVIDGGSQITAIKESVSRSLSLPIVRTQKTAILAYGSNSRSVPKTCNVVKVMLKSQHDGTTIAITAIETPNICFDVLAVPDAAHPKLRHLKLADARTGDMQAQGGLSLLIGADQLYKISKGNTQRIDDQLMAVETVFGWTLHGPFGSSCGSEVQNALVSSLCACDHSDDRSGHSFDLQQLWSLETIGIRNEAMAASNDEFVQRYVRDSIERNNEGRYVVQLPFKDERPVNIDDNKIGAVGQFHRLTNRLSKTPEKLLEYDSEIQTLIQSGFAEVAPPVSDSPVYYLPHRAVYREDKTTTKVRVVFNASAHQLGFPSLNDLLYAGPNLNPDIVSVLVNFRMGAIAYTSDIEKAFLQIGLQQTERDYHRFLWYHDPLTTTATLPPVQEFRMCRVTFGVRSSPFILSATIRHHLNQSRDRYVETCDALNRGFYVDDLIGSCDTYEQVERLYTEATSIMADAKMTLRKWATNDDTFRSIFGDTGMPERAHKVLGLVWCTSSDTLSIDLTTSSCPPTTAETKRTVLRKTSQIFDPLGLIAPCVVTAKLLLQTAWKLHLPWDSPLPADMLTTWSQWYRQLRVLNDFAVPRHALNVNVSDPNVQLHVFADASPSAYGAAAYLRSRGLDGGSQVSLLCAKSRVAPLKTDNEAPLSLAKLELTAALIASRLAGYLATQLVQPIDSVTLWSDSLITLYWIKGDSTRWQPYVANRVREIQGLTQKEQWRHCPGSDNPADMLTRGVSAPRLIDSTVWVSGPEWLQGDDDCWPHDKSPLYNASVMVTSLLLPNATSQSIPVPDLDRFSQLRRLLRAAAYVQRAQHNFRCRLPDRKTGPLTVLELEQADRYLIRAAQMDAWASEIACLEQSKPISRESKILSLSPFLDDNGLLRIGGRLQEVDESFESRHPVLLPKESRLSLLLVYEIHYERLQHAGVASVLTVLRSRYWIIRGRQLVKSALSSCVICRRLNARAANEPAAPLPHDRVTRCPPFEVTGVDFAGPLFVKTGASEEPSKAYVLLFTCAVVRAIHIELTPDMTAESCLNAFRRFMGRRGVPRIVYSDNARSFKRASIELQGVASFIEGPTLQGLLEERRIEWRFIVERAPWWGGWWERLVRSVKTSLKAALGKRLLSYEQLVTLLVEIEATVNSRPLTYVADLPNEPQSLTPAHFLSGTPLTIFPSSNIPSSSPNADFRSEWRKRQRVLNVFWSRWSAEYLHQLRSAHHSPPGSSSGIQPGDVVIVHEATTPRLRWKMGVVNKCFPGRDGKIRACEIRVVSGKSCTILRRPVQCLYPLSLNEQ